jgi:FlaG/FlaF family flagellin (archaellin)
MTDRFRSSTSHRAVSDVVAFVLVFSIIIASVGVVSVFGFGALDDLQEGEQNANAERAMAAMAVGMEDVLKHRSPRRQLSMNPQGKTLIVAGETRSNVTITVNLTSGGNVTETASGALVYAPEANTEIGYEAGAVVRRERDRATMVRGPLTRCDSGTHASVTMPDLSQDGQAGGISSDGSVAIEARIPNNRRLTSKSVYPGDRLGTDVSNVTIDVSDSAYPSAWEDHLENEGWVETSSDVYKCDVGTGGTAFVRNPELVIEFTT